jgi:hypothetical protein
MTTEKRLPDRSSEEKELPQGLQIGVLDDANLALLVEFRETDRLDFKSTISISDKKSCQELSKDVSALSNTLGGYIVVGVSDRPRGVVGIRPSVEKILDPTTISQAVSRYISPAITVQTYVGDYRSNDGDFRIGLIYVPEFRKRPHFIPKTSGYQDQKTSDHKVGLRAGTIYVRRQAASQPIDPDSWERLLDRYFLRALRIRQIEEAEIGGKQLFALDRKSFIRQAFKELAR